MPNVTSSDFYNAENRFHHLYEKLHPDIQSDILATFSSYTFGVIVGVYYQYGGDGVEVTDEGAQLIAAFNSPYAEALFKAWLIRKGFL